jgi:colanic acid biosynthesis glycosyl transferase WcaI
LIPHIPEIQVKIVGDGEYRPQLKELVKTLHLENYICFTGFVPMETIPGLISQSDIGVVPVLMQMQPTKLFEYVAIGTPVVSADFPAIRICFNEDSVRYYTPGDAQQLAGCILDLYRDPEKRMALSKASSNIYQKYHWSVMKLEYLKVFDNLTNRAGAITPEEK